MYTAIRIANFFIESHLHDKGRPIDSLKLQKMVYITYGWYWALLDKKLFEDEIQAWDYGPVIPSVWYAFKQQGDEIREIYGMSLKYSIFQTSKEIFEAIYEAYINHDNAELALITHVPGTPWDSVYDSKIKKEIPKGTIWRYFELLYAQRKKVMSKETKF